MSITPSSKNRSCSLLAFYSSSLGKKFFVAVTGIALVFFLIGHLVGNLTVFAGQDAINTYALKLHELGDLLWVARIGLIVIAAVHIILALQLTVENHQARPSKYAVHKMRRATIFVRTMRASGIVILGFVIFHLAHFTWMTMHPEWRNLVDGAGRHDVYSMVIHGFSSPMVSLIYLLALGLLAFHLSHGVASVFQTLGWTSDRMRPLYEKGALIFSWALFAGFASIPLAVLTGILNLPKP